MVAVFFFIGIILDYTFFINIDSDSGYCIAAGCTATTWYE